jgi:gamma-glutamyltranspeptidase/glutathione hydrolase
MRTISVALSFFVLLLSTSITCFGEEVIVAHHAIVVSEVKSASQIGIDILKAGGNAIDAAVSVGYALSVVNPCCGNIGGGGFMLIHLATGDNIFINFREKAPLAATKNMFLDANGNVIPNKTTYGYLAVSVPGTPLGLDTALQKFGTMKREEVMAPAINLALNGHVVTKTEAKWFRAYAKEFQKQPSVAKIFLKDGGPYEEGDRLFQRDLAKTLMLISKYGPRAFYEGPIAHEIVKASQEAGGILTSRDFADYRVEILKPIECSYRNYTVLSSPPPSSGGVALCEMLNILENFNLKEMGHQSPVSLRYIIESMRYGFWDRNTELGDPNFVKVPVDKLISKSYASDLSEQIRHSNFIVRHYEMSKHELTDTTHYSIVDKEGNAVAVTYTINGFFGAKVIAGNTGFFLNDEMDDFTAQVGEENKFGLVQSSKNDIRPGKRPLSSMTPTIVLKNNRVFMVLGSPGGPRIITSLLLTILNVIDYGMNIKEAINAPRFHYQGIPDAIDIEPFALPFFTTKKLEYLGYHFTSQETWGAVEAILIDTQGKLYGANDYRRPDGAAIGY